MELRKCSFRIRKGVSATLKDWSKHSRTISLEDVITIVCRNYKVDAKVIGSPTRKSEIVKARQQIMYLAYKYSDLSLSTIGRHFNRDHTSVLYAKECISNMCYTDENYKNELEALERIVSRRNF